MVIDLNHYQCRYSLNCLDTFREGLVACLREKVVCTDKSSLLDIHWIYSNKMPHLQKCYIRDTLLDRDSCDFTNKGEGNSAEESAFTDMIFRMYTVLGQFAATMVKAVFVPGG